MASSGNEERSWRPKETAPARQQSCPIRFHPAKSKGETRHGQNEFRLFAPRNPCAQCGKPIATPEWIENGPRRTSYLWHCWACDTTSSRRWPSSRNRKPSRLDGTPARASRWSRFINPTGGDDDRCHDKTAPADRERPDRRYRGATAERRPDRPHRAADDRQDQRQGILRDSSVSAGSTAWEPT